MRFKADADFQRDARADDLKSPRRDIDVRAVQASKDIRASRPGGLIFPLPGPIIQKPKLDTELLAHCFPLCLSTLSHATIAGP